MRRLVADHLEPRIDRAAVLVQGKPVAAEALDLLRRGLVWTVDYHDGRLLGDIGAWHAAAIGDRGLLRRYLDAGGEGHTPLVRRAFAGDPLTRDERAALSPYERGKALLCDRAYGRPLDRAEATATAEELDAGNGADLRALIDQPIGDHRRPLTDEPIEEVVSSTFLEPYDYVRSGDHAGCLRQLDLRFAQAARALDAGEPPAVHVWRQIATMTRFLTGDDALAMQRLERLRIGDLRDEWLQVFGPLGSARLQREQDEVLAAIERAFDGVPFPGRRHRSLYQAQAADDCAGCDQARDHQGRWQELPRAHILACQFALPHLDAAGLPYYLPAIMSFAVREAHERRDDHGSRWIFESLEYQFYVEMQGRSQLPFLRDRFARFTAAQLAAIVRFLDYYRSRPQDRARWRVVAERGAWPTD